MIAALLLFTLAGCGGDAPAKENPVEPELAKRFEFPRLGATLREGERQGPEERRPGGDRLPLAGARQRHRLRRPAVEARGAPRRHRPPPRRRRPGLRFPLRGPAAGAARRRGADHRLALHPLARREDPAGKAELEPTYETMVQNVQDVLRGLDIMVDQYDVDPDRLGIVGYSMGAQPAALAAALDPRVRALVLMAGRALPSGLPNDPQERELFGAIDTVDYVDNLAPTHLLLQGAEYDSIIPAARWRCSRRRRASRRRSAGTRPITISASRRGGSGSRGSLTSLDCKPVTPGREAAPFRDLARPRIKSAAMASTVPAERELRRVIGDGDAVPDGEVEGLGEQELLELYRSMVLLRTYDERSVVYHRQGRIGTYAIFWGHEAIQAGAVYALEDEDWIFPSYRESAIGLLRGMPPRPSSPGGAAIRPAGGTRPTTTSPRSASRSRPTSRTRPGSRGGSGCAARRACAIAFFGDGATSEGAFHEGANFAAVMRAPLVLFCNNNQLGDLDAALGADARGDARRQGGRLRDPGRARRRRRRARRLRGDARGGRAGAGRRRADLHRGRHVPRRAACDRRRPERVHRPRARRGGARERVPRPLRGLPAPARRPRRRARRRHAGRGGGADARGDRGRRGRAAGRRRRSLFEHAFADPPASFEHDLAELRRILGG